jgi:hypothetical protein
MITDGIARHVNSNASRPVFAKSFDRALFENGILPSDGRTFGAARMRYVVIEDMEFNNDPNSGHPHALSLVDCEKVIIRNCRFVGTGSWATGSNYGICLDYCQTVLIENVQVIGCSIGVCLSGCESVEINGVLSDNCEYIADLAHCGGRHITAKNLTATGKGGTLLVGVPEWDGDETTFVSVEKYSGPSVSITSNCVGVRISDSKISGWSHVRTFTGYSCRDVSFEACDGVKVKASKFKKPSDLTQVDWVPAARELQVFGSNTRLEVQNGRPQVVTES